MTLAVVAVAKHCDQLTRCCVPKTASAIVLIRKETLAIRTVSQIQFSIGFKGEQLLAGGRVPDAYGIRGGSSELTAIRTVGHMRDRAGVSLQYLYRLVSV